MAEGGPRPVLAAEPGVMDMAAVQGRAGLHQDCRSGSGTIPGGTHNPLAGLHVAARPLAPRPQHRERGSRQAGVGDLSRRAGNGPQSRAPVPRRYYRVSDSVLWEPGHAPVSVGDGPMQPAIDTRP